jgi:hypothetical protein
VFIGIEERGATIRRHLLKENRTVFSRLIQPIQLALAQDELSNAGLGGETFRTITMDSPNANAVIG